LCVIYRPTMAEQVDISDYNYFDVEDFSVDSFFRSLELQSRFASNDLEFTFPADLENVPISSCLTSPGFLESSPAKSSSNADRGPSVTEDIPGCSSGVTEGAAETSIADLNDDDNAAAVDVFFQSLQLRSCLLRSDDDIAGNSPRCSQIKANASSDAGDLFMYSRTADVSSSGIKGKADETLSDNDERDVITPCDSHSGVLSEKSLTNFDCLSSALTCSSDSRCEDHQSVQRSSSSVHVRQSETTIAPTSATRTASNSSAGCSGLCKTALLAEQAGDCADQLCRQEQPQLATTEDSWANSRERHAVKGGKMGCDVCGVMLSDKYSYVRHLLTPLHRRRADGYCINVPPSAVTNSDHTEDVSRLLARQKPAHCRVCLFYGDTASQLLCHLKSASHCAQVKRKLLQCVPCRFVGTCEDITTHVKSDSHVTLVSQSNRPSVIAAWRSGRHHGQFVGRQTKDDKSCGLCGAKFPSTSSLEIHARRRHTGQRPFRCGVCCKAYCDNSTLTLHYKTARHRTKCAQVERYSSTV